VRIIGISVLPPSVCMVLELCAYGSLSDVLRGSGSGRVAFHLSERDQVFLALGCARSVPPSLLPLCLLVSSHQRGGCSSLALFSDRPQGHQVLQLLGFVFLPPSLTAPLLSPPLLPLQLTLSSTQSWQTSSWESPPPSLRGPMV
jgi:hypothetical protein